MGETENGVDNPQPASSESENPKIKSKGGRPVGSRNRDKVLLQGRIQKKERIIFAQLMRWVESPDGLISLAAIKLALAYGWGKPPEKILIGNEGGRPFVIAAPKPVESFEDWERLVNEAEQIAADADASSS